MFWRIEHARSFAMPDMNGNALPHLIVNRAQIVSDGCVACGKEFASAPTGERTLSAAIGQDSTYMFCAQCGDSIMGRVQADSARQHYSWDWAVPLRGKALNQNGNGQF
jgi:hypothetical protein